MFVSFKKNIMPHIFLIQNDLENVWQYPFENDYFTDAGVTKDVEKTSLKQEEIKMEIKKPAMAGTLESSDCQVTVEPGNGSVEFNLESAVINQYGNQIRKVVLQTLENLDVKGCKNFSGGQGRAGLYH